MSHQDASSHNTDPPSESSAKDQATAGNAGAALNGIFFERFYQAYLREVRGNGESGPEPPSRIPPPPLNSPAFPNAYWSYGDSSVIGATNTTNSVDTSLVFGADWRSLAKQQCPDLRLDEWRSQFEQVRCFAPEWAVVNYLQREMSPHDYISIRNDILDDLKGQRTGFKTLYSEHSIAWGHWISDLITIRPELRFDRAYGMPAFNFGTKQNQVTFAIDVIVRY